MLYTINNRTGIAALWLTQGERLAAGTTEDLSPVSPRESLPAAVFISGERDLYTQTSRLLCRNVPH